MKFLITGGEYLERYPNFKLVGRDKEIRSLMSILMRSKAASVLLVGPGGVGSTALCVGLQAMKSDPSVPFDIITKRIHWLDTDKLVTCGDIKKAFARVATTLRRTDDSILIIEDAKSFIHGLQNAGAIELLNTLNAMVKRGETQVIMEVREDDLEMVLKTNNDMQQYYTMIDLAEPVGEDLQKIVTYNAEALAASQKVIIDPSAITTAIELLTKYRTRAISQASPSAQTHLLDQALANYRLEAHANTEPAKLEEFRKLYDNIREAEIEIENIDEAVESIRAEEAASREEARRRGEQVDDTDTDMLDDFYASTGDVGHSTAVRDKLKLRLEYEKSIGSKDEKTGLYPLGSPRRRLEELTLELNSGLVLTADRVMAEFSRLSGIPVNKLNEDEREKLKTLADSIKTQLFGQDHVVDAISNAIKIARVGRRNGNKPQASFMLLGPSGTGKTEICKALARSLLDDEAALTRFDMSEFMEKHSVSKLIGAPAGYEGFEMGGILTNAMRRNPRRIVLFDEIEKAHPDVFNIFLQILSDGRLTDNRGLTVSFSESIIIMTSNIGQPELLDTTMEVSERHAAALAALEATPGIRPEFLNRFAGRQNILFFNILEHATVERIVRREITGLGQAYAGNNIRVNMPDEELSKFVHSRYDAAIGARGLPGFIQATLEPLIVNTILDNPEYSGDVNIHYDLDKRSFVADFGDYANAA